MNLVRCILAGVVLALLASASLRAQLVFADDFTSGASSQWSNQLGGWTASGGVYFATAPNNQPPTYTSLPFTLTDFALTVTINNLSDGGIWLRSADSSNGVLLITGGYGRTGTGLYWHEVVNGNFSPPVLNPVDGLFVNGSGTTTIKISAIGNTYSAYVNDATIPVTTLTSTLFSSGRVGLYSFSSQTFDSFAVYAIPEPSTVLLLGLGLAVLRAWRGERRVGR